MNEFFAKLLNFILELKPYILIQPWEAICRRIRRDTRNVWLEDVMTEQEKREAVVLLAKSVMGWHVQEAFEPEPTDSRTIAWVTDEHLYAREYVEGRCCRTLQFDPFDSVADAWMLVEALRDRLYCEVTLEVEPYHLPDCIIFKGGVVEARESGSTMPEAICKAALRAVSDDQT